MSALNLFCSNKGKVRTSMSKTLFAAGIR